MLDNDHYSPDQQMVWSLFDGPGYHSMVPKGVKTHPTRESMNYALELLADGDVASIARAELIILKVLSLQERDPVNPAYGIWPWLLEEPISEMRPPDWNWADFIGIRLCKVLAHHADKLSSNVDEEIRTALGHAAWSIFRRNVGPGYTNIAIMGAAVTLAAGELLGEHRLLEYGRRRINALVDYTSRTGELEEYNSPTYTVVALDEAENILNLVHDDAALADARVIWHTAWRTIAEHYHPPTGQWAGPHSRNYRDLLPETVIPELLNRKIACPDDVRQRFESLPAPEIFWSKKFVQRANENESIWCSTWLTPDVALGSANRETLWHQKRPLLGYWRSGDGSVAVLRPRFYHDGKDFASASIQSVQSKGKVLSAFGIIEGCGDFHPSLDKPANGVFTGSDFRLRYELTATDADAVDLGGGCYALSSGNRTAIIHAIPASFEELNIKWSVGREGSTVFVEADVWSGSLRSLDPKLVEDLALAAGLEIVPIGQKPSPPPKFVHHSGPGYRVDWEIDGHTDLTVYSKS